MRPFILRKFQGFRDEREALAITAEGRGGSRGAWDDGQSRARVGNFTLSVLLVAVSITYRSRGRQGRGSGQFRELPSLAETSSLCDLQISASCSGVSD